jgi:membrane associated rhomboid family serine protease
MRYGDRSQNALWILIGINLLVFVATSVNQGLVLSMGLRPSTAFSRPWTLLTSIFVHDNIWHILTNMITLYFFGSFLSRLIGSARFLVVYFLAGVMGSIAYVLLWPSASLVVGASGAIFGLGGVMTVLAPKLRVFIFPIPAPLPLWVAIIGGFVIISFLPGIAWQAHLGGLVTGLACGYYFRRRGRFAIW